MGNGSVGSRTYCDVPVIHALPVIVGTTASSPATVVASTSRPMNGRSSRDVLMKSASSPSSPRACSWAIRALVPVPQGERSK